VIVGAGVNVGALECEGAAENEGLLLGIEDGSANGIILGGLEELTF
jgi:hypothetical protein